MAEPTIETGVDDLLGVLQQTDHIAVSELAQKLRIEQAVVQTWIDFLVEENIVGVEYKFITPYVFLIKKTQESSEIENKDPIEIKQEFYQKALERKIPLTRINFLWNQYLTNNIISIKEQFVAKAKERGMDAQSIDKLWNRYKVFLHKSEQE